MPKICVTWNQNVFGNAKVEKKGKGQYEEENLDKFSCIDFINNYGQI